MKSKIFFIVISLFVSVENLNAQEKAGCDLCGPSSGTTQNVVSGNYSATIGVSCDAVGAFSLAVGNASKANAGNTIAMGKFVRANATNAVVIGSGVSNTNTRALINSKSNTMMIGFNSIYPTVFVSNSTAYNKTGKVGIGNVTAPKSKFHIKSDANEDSGITLETTSLTNTAYLQLFDDKHKISVTNGKGMSILSTNDNINMDAKNIVMNAKVGINASNKFTEGYDYAFAVSGGILTNELYIKEVSEWYDFVFDDDYQLKSLSDLELFIDNNGHLPDIPSESHVIKEGYDMVEMDGLLLKKIEELTLYTIELNKIIKSQQEQIESLLSR